MEDIRWKQRFDNYNRAYLRLSDAVTATENEPQNMLYIIALVGAFQFTFELGWKTLKDYLQFSGVDVSLPREVIKLAFHHQLISNGQVWIDMLGDRNIMAHVVYQEAQARVVLQNIRNNYLSALEELQHFFQSKMDTE